MQPAPAGTAIADDLSIGPPSLHRDGDTVVIDGQLRIEHLPDPDSLDGVARIELAGLTGMDTAGAWFLEQARRKGLELCNLPAPHEALLDRVSAAWPVAPEHPPVSGRRGLLWAVEQLGMRVSFAAVSILGLVEYLGRFLAAWARTLVAPRRFPLTALVHHCQAVGFAAVPIVVTISFLIGVVVAYQGAYQLRYFGADIFTVDLVGIAVLRELAILLTAIVVAGRTGAAFTAALGAMKMREEIDAMRTLDIDPDETLILPRVLALVLMMPILALIGDVAGLAGGAVMVWASMDISLTVFLSRLSENVGVASAFVGLVKAPVFGLLIGIIGCRSGMLVGGDTESLGRMTSDSVVAAIFAVIVADAGFSIFFAQVGL